MSLELSIIICTALVIESVLLYVTITKNDNYKHQLTNLKRENSWLKRELKKKPVINICKLKGGESKSGKQ